MTKQIILQALCLTFTLNLLSQSLQPDGDFIYTWNKKLIQAPRVEYVDRIIKESYFIADSITLNESNVMYARLYGMHIANLAAVSSAFTPTWGVCFSEGKLNFYEHQVIYFTSAGASTTLKYFYYSHDFEPLKIATYKNMVVDLADNPASMKCLEDFRTLQTVEALSYITAAGLIIGGIVTNTHATEANPNAGIPMVIGGVVCYGLTALLIRTFLKPEMLKKAAINYNLK